MTVVMKMMVGMFTMNGDKLMVLKISIMIKHNISYKMDSKLNSD